MCTARLAPRLHHAKIYDELHDAGHYASRRLSAEYSFTQAASFLMGQLPLPIHYNYV